MPENTASTTEEIMIARALDELRDGLDQRLADEAFESLKALHRHIKRMEKALREIQDLDLDDDTLWWNRNTPLAPKAVVIARRALAPLDQEEAHA